MRKLIPTIAACALFSLGAGQAAAGDPPADGLVGHWGFDENSGSTALDSSPLQLHGTIEGARRVPGKRGGALAFTGPEAVNIPNHPALEITGDITIAAWVFKESSNNATRWDAIMSKSPGKWDYELLTSMSKSDELAFYSKTGTPSEIYSTRPVPVGRWVHVAVTRRGDEAIVYLDGEVASRVRMTGAFPKTGGGLQLGQDGAKKVNGLIGKLDEVYLYSRALTPAEIKALM